MIKVKLLREPLKATLLGFFFLENMLLAQQANAVCRDLVPTDPYYSGWTRCCDIDTTLGHSNWIRRGGNGNNERYAGSCALWGIKDQPLQSVCRDLRPGDNYYNAWSRCCDEGNNQSRWFQRWGGNPQGQLYSGNCRYWGINP